MVRKGEKNEIAIPGTDRKDCVILIPGHEFRIVDRQTTESINESFRRLNGGYCEVDFQLAGGIYRRVLFGKPPRKVDGNFVYEGVIANGAFFDLATVTLDDKRGGTLRVG